MVHVLMMMCPFPVNSIRPRALCVSLNAWILNSISTCAHTRTHTCAHARAHKSQLILYSHWALAQIRVWNTHIHTRMHTHMIGEANLPKRTWLKGIMRLWWLHLKKLAPPWHHLWPWHDPPHFALIHSSCGNLHFWLAEPHCGTWNKTVANQPRCSASGCCIKAKV